MTGAVAAPVTLSGKIVVNDVEASCYAMGRVEAPNFLRSNSAVAAAGNHEQLHQMLAPFRMLYQLSPRSASALSSIGVMSMDFLSWVMPIEQYLGAMLAVSVATALTVPTLTVVLGLHKLLASKAKSF